MKKEISNIVFTMNRPLQLDAYLASLYRHFPRSRIQTHILYKKDKFHDQYLALFKGLPDCSVIEETHFRHNLVDLISRVDTEYILFGTDDVVYYDSVDLSLVLEALKRYHGDIFGFSLRLGPQGLAESGDTIQEIELLGQKVYRINWKKAKNPIARYPFELNSTIYSRDLVQDILARVAKERPFLKKVFRPDSFLLKVLGLFVSRKDFLANIRAFNNPNTLEGYCYRWCKSHPSRFPDYLYFQKPCASAIQINRVNTVIDNPVDGLTEHTVDALNDMYRQGYRLDLEAIEEQKPKTTHAGREHFRLVRG